MSKLYITEFQGLAATTNSDVDLVAEPATLTQKLDTTATTGAINALGAVTAGTLYTNGTYTNVPLTGGTGSGAVGTVTVAGGGVTAVALTNRGAGYTAADSLSAAAANIGGSGSGFAVAVTSIAVQSAPFQPTTRFIEIECDATAPASFVVGVCASATGIPLSPVATASNNRLNTNDRILRGVPPESVQPNGVVNAAYALSAITNT